MSNPSASSRLSAASTWGAPFARNLVDGGLSGADRFEDVVKGGAGVAPLGGPAGFLGFVDEFLAEVFGFVSGVPRVGVAGEKRRPFGPDRGGAEGADNGGGGEPRFQCRVVFDCFDECGGSGAASCLAFAWEP